MPGFVISGFEGGRADPSAVIETARAHRWEVTYIPGVSGVDESWWPRHIAAYAVSVTRPTIEFDKIQMHHRSNEVYLPGKKRAGVCILKVYESINSSDSTNMTANIFRQWWDQAMNKGGQHSFRTPSNNINTVKRQLRIRQLGGCGEVLWTYLLAGAFPLKVEPTELDYSSSELSNIAITLSIDAFREGKDI